MKYFQSILVSCVFAVFMMVVMMMMMITMVHCERIQYHSQGHSGPYSYKFGYDTGPGQGYNRQFRHEERDAYGNVYGKYGYYTKNGKPVVVYYRSHPKYGFEVMKHGNY